MLPKIEYSSAVSQLDGAPFPSAEIVYECLNEHFPRRCRFQTLLIPISGPYSTVRKLMIWTV
jgi:hypothetical protein